MKDFTNLYRIRFKKFSSIVKHHIHRLKQNVILEFCNVVSKRNYVIEKWTFYTMTPVDISTYFEPIFKVRQIEHPFCEIALKLLLLFLK